MFIVWGSKWQYKTKSNGLHVEKMCPECDKRGTFFEVIPQKMFTVFWIPVSPRETKKSLLECPNCQVRLYIQSSDYLNGIKELTRTRNVIHLPNTSVKEIDNVSILDCEHCGQSLRIPTKQERLKVTCPSCKEPFYAESGQKVS